MAALTIPTNGSITLSGSEVNKYGQGVPAVVTLTLASATDTYTHPVGVSAWAMVGDPTDLHNVTFAPNTRVFSIVSVSGTARTLTLLIWQAK